MAEDVTLFVDDSVICAGPPMDGPSLYQWAQTVDDETLRALASPELYREIRGLSAMSFPTRRVQSVYLDWFHRQVVDALPPHVEVIRHTAAAVDLFDGDDGRQYVVLDSPDARPLVVDVVVLSLGHLDATPDDVGRRWRSSPASTALPTSRVATPPTRTSPSSHRGRTFWCSGSARRSPTCSCS